MQLDEMKPFSVSKNFYVKVVVPLYKSGNVVNLDGLLDLLKKLHCSLWDKSGKPAGFSGAIAGNFQEILDGYFTAVVAGHKVQYGSVGKIGGDTVKEIEVGKGCRLTVKATSQFKVTASHAGEVREHICKAVWQLTGAGGETPESGSQRIVEVIVQDDSMTEPRSDKAMSEFTQDDWKETIVEALSEGYSKQKPAKTKEELYNAVDYIYITTVAKRFIYLVGGTTLGVLYMGGGPPTRHAYVFKGGNFERHWLWLTNDYQNTIRGKGYDYVKVQKFGVGSGQPKTPDELPAQPAG